MRGTNRAEGGYITIENLVAKSNSAGLVAGNCVTRHTSVGSGGRVPERRPLVLRDRVLLERRRILEAQHREGVTRPLCANGKVSSCRSGLIK